MNEQMQVWAHEYALEKVKQGLSLTVCVQLGWKYAETMQAQAEQRRAPEPDLDKPTIPPMGEFSKLKYSDDFEVDWSEVPTRYRWWAKDKDGKCGFFVDEPVLCSIRDMWLIDKHSTHDFLNYYIECPLDWRSSLRQRPSSK